MWDDLFARDSDGNLANRLQELVDGDEQRIFTSDAATFRNELFNTPQLKAMVSHLSDEDLESLASNLGGHDMVKINAAYAAAEASDKPTVIIARTIKGYGLGTVPLQEEIQHMVRKRPTKHPSNGCAMIWNYHSQMMN